MWVELICGFVVFSLLKRYFYDDGDADLLDLDSSDADVLFAVADRLQKLYGGKCYVGLDVPDADSASRQNIDMVLVTDREAMVVSVVNVSGTVSVDQNDGSWVYTTTAAGKHHHKHKSEQKRLPDPIAEVKEQVSILEAYLEQRGLTLPEEYLTYKVICPNPQFRTAYSTSFPSEVITYEKWTELKPEHKNMLSGWIKGAFRGGKKEQESFHQQLNLILKTAPMLDRIELKNNKFLLGEFLEFSGKQDDIQALRNVKRSKVSHLIIQKTSMFGLAHSKLQVLYSPRDYRSEGTSASEWKEVTVRSNTEVLFQPRNSKKVRKYKLSSLVSMSLSA